MFQLELESEAAKQPEDNRINRDNEERKNTLHVGFCDYVLLEYNPHLLQLGQT